MDINQIKKILKKVIADKENWIRYPEGRWYNFRNSVSPERKIYLRDKMVYFIEEGKEDLIIEDDFSEEIKLLIYKEKINLKDWP